MMEIVVETSDFRSLEREYILDVVLGTRLGLSWQRKSSEGKSSEGKGVCVKVLGQAGKIMMPDMLFKTRAKDWLMPQSLPKQPLPIWKVSLDLPKVHCVKRELPVLFGQTDLEGRWCNKLGENSLQIGLDIFGSTFYMLTRYEEVVKPEQDRHGRFPAWASLAYQEGFLDRPIVDEYIEVLWAALKSLWPGLQRRTRCFSLFPTHDIDHPFSPIYQSLARLSRTLGGDLLRRRSISKALKRAGNFMRFKQGKIKDPFDSFDWLMDISEEMGLKSAFYFRSSKKGTFDPEYSFTDPRIKSIIQRIIERGHEIGFHPGYKAGMNKKVWMQECEALRLALPSTVSMEGGRQHYLRFKVPDTWRYWAEADFTYDSSLAFADHAGFRCGTCHQFRVFDVVKRQQLEICERPLIMMEYTVLGERYMGFQNKEEALDYILNLKKRCWMFQGEFVLLWHNSRLASYEEKSLYKSVLRG